MSHVTVEGFELRFPNTQVNSEGINTLLGDAEDWLMSCLGEFYTVPFSSNNVTSQRLIYQKTFHLLRLRSLDPDDSDEMGDSLDKQIKALQNGTKGMLTTSGDFISSTPTNTDPGQTIWSNTMTYKPTFDEDDAERQKVDHFKITNTRAERT